MPIFRYFHRGSALTFYTRSLVHVFTHIWQFCLALWTDSVSNTQAYKVKNQTHNLYSICSLQIIAEATGIEGLELFWLGIHWVTVVLY